MKKLLPFLVIGSVLGLTLWWFVDGETNPEKAAAAAKSSAPSSTEGRSAMTATAGAATGPSVATATPSTNVAPLTPAQLEKRRLSAEFEKATDLKALYDKYATSNDPAQRYYAAKALMECAEAQRQRGRVNFIQTARDSRLSSTDPKFAQRNAAFDGLLVDRCQGFPADQLTSSAINLALAEAAKLGDPAARAAQARSEINSRIAAAARQRQQYTLTEGDLTAIQDSIRSKDPDAIRQIADFGTLWNRADGLRVGPDQSGPSMQSWVSAWRMLACDSGLDCGSEHRDLLAACALDGACGAPNYQAYLQQFAQSPYHYQETQRYQELIRSAIEQGRWDWLGLGSTATLGMRPPTALQTPPKK